MWSPSTTVKNLTVDQGAPLVLVPCGMPGAQWVKHLGTIDFKVADQFMDGPTYAAADGAFPEDQRERHVVPEQRPERKGGRESGSYRCLHLLEPR